MHVHERWEGRGPEAHEPGGWLFGDGWEAWWSLDGQRMVLRAADGSWRRERFLPGIEAHAMSARQVVERDGVVHFEVVQGETYLHAWSERLPWPSPNTSWWFESIEVSGAGWTAGWSADGCDAWIAIDGGGRSVMHGEPIPPDVRREIVEADGWVEFRAFDWKSPGPAVWARVLPPPREEPRDPLELWRTKDGRVRLRSVAGQDRAVVLEVAGTLMTVWANEADELATALFRFSDPILMDHGD